MNTSKYTLSIWLFCALLPIKLNSAQQEDFMFENWPLQWIECYKRFEAYIELKEEFWQKSDLTIDHRGIASHNLQIAESSNMHLTLTIEAFGSIGGGWISNIAMKNRARLNDKDTRLSPGTYSANIKSTSSLGYQHHFPIIWFQVELVTPSQENQASRGRSFKVIESPKNPNSIWPNHRFLNFVDFHVYTERRNPNDLKHKNELLTPGIIIQAHNNGVIKRDQTLDSKVEPLLKWNVYKYGELVEQKSAHGQTELSIPSSYGSYRVFLSVDGPDGPMPVSNILSFPYFPTPDRNGQFECIPRDLDQNKQPDLIEEITYRMSNPSNTITKQDIRVLKLWQAWKWQLTHTRQKYIGIDIYPSTR